MGTMAKRPDEAVTEFLRAALDDRLRQVGRVQPDGYVSLYRRADVLDDPRAPPGIGGDRNHRPPPGSAPECVVAVTGDVVTFAVRAPTGVPIVASVDRAGELPLLSLVDGCLDRLDPGGGRSAR